MTVHSGPAGRSWPGLFVVFEGGDGSGKSTQAQLLAQTMRQAGARVELTREPGGTPIAEALREVVLDPVYAPVDPVTEALIYAAARSSHVHDTLLPWLNNGAVVISDRFLDSSLAYQGAGRGLGAETVGTMNAPGLRGVVPDLTIVLSLPVEHARSRQGVRKTSDRIESESDEFHGSLGPAFDELAAKDSGRYLVIDARQSIDDIATQICDAVMNKAQQRGLLDSSARRQNAERRDQA